MLVESTEHLTMGVSETKLLRNVGPMEQTFISIIF